MGYVDEVKVDDIEYDFEWRGMYFVKEYIDGAFSINCDGCYFKENNVDCNKEGASHCGLGIFKRVL